MQGAYIPAARMLPFGKYPSRSAAQLGREVVIELLREERIAASEIEAVFAGQSFSGAIDGQHAVPGQVALRGTGIEDLPVFNIENACASTPSAIHLAVQSVRSRQYELVLVLAMDKLYALERNVSMRALIGAMDVDESRDLLSSDAVNGSVFMDTYYGRIAREYLRATGATKRDLARVAVKNRKHASLNEFAQYRTPISEEEVLASPLVADPLTKLMCSPLTDGAAAFIVCSEARARRFDGPRVRVASSVIRSGRVGPLGGGPAVIKRASAQAFEEAQCGPQDLDLAEVHEASAVGELLAVEQLGLCPPGRGAEMLREGATAIGGTCPVNVSGGLLSRGHPGAATGAAQVVELVWQLMGRCGERQVADARLGLAQSSGGLINEEAACTAITILERSD